MKALPQAPNAERGILGALMQDASLMGHVLASIQPEDMWRPEHRRLLQLMAGRVRDGRAIDGLTLADAMAVSETTGLYGGISTVLGHVDCCPSVLALNAWLREVRDAADRRAAVELAQNIEAAASHGQPISDLVSQLASLQAGMGSTSKPARRFGDVYREVLEDLALEAEGKGERSAMPTGWPSLDAYIGGFRPGEFTILAARPSMGKTALALNAALQQSDQARRVVVFSLEMASRNLVRRCVATIGRVSGDRLMRPETMDTDDWERALDGQDYADGVDIMLEETNNLTAAQIVAKVKAHAVQGVDMVIIDHLGEMEHPKADRHDLSVGESAAMLKRMGQDVGCHVVLLQQLNRGVEQRADKRPMKSDLRDSGRVEELADNILFVYRDHYYNPEDADPRMLDLIVAKCRMGRMGTAHLQWDGPLQLVAEEFDGLALVGGDQ